jgi:hypothetical protein
MKKFYLWLLQVAFLGLIVTSTAFSAPSVDGVMGTDWSSDSYSNFDGVVLGGQNYTIEKLGMFIDSTDLYFGIQTGFELNYKEGSGILPGDISISFTQGSQSWDFGIKYSVDHIQDQDWAAYNHEYKADLALYSVSEWNTVGEKKADGSTDDTPLNDYTIKAGSLIASVADAGSYTRSPQGSLDSSGNVVYEYNPSDGTTRPYNNTLEGAISLSNLSSALTQLNKEMDYDVAIQWTMSCGNDVLEFQKTFPGTPGTPGDPVPEPATLLLFGMGLLGAGALGRREQKKDNV